MNDEGIILPESHSQSNSSAPQDFFLPGFLVKIKIFNKYLSDPFFGNQWCTVFLFPIFPKSTRSYSRNAAHTHCYFVAGDFDVIICSFRKLRIMQMKTTLLRF